MKLIKFLCAVILALVLGNVTLANQSLDASVQMAQVAEELATLDKETSILEAELAAESSLAQILPRIENLGFVAPTKILAIGEETTAVASR
jgi:hypothetical protein